MALADLKKTKGGELPRVGKIRPGEKTEKGFPTGTDHFTIKGDTEGELEAIKVYGEKPKEIVVYFPNFPARNIEEWKDKVRKIEYVSYSRDTGSGGSLRFKGDDTSGIIKCKRMYKALIGEEPKGDMPKGGWKIELPDGVTWDDHEGFQKIFNCEKPQISIKCTISVILDKVFANGVFTISTSSESAINNINRYIDGLVAIQGMPYMVATKISKRKVKIPNPKGGFYTPFIMEFSRMNNWQELSTSYMSTIEEKRSEVMEIANKLYQGTGSISKQLQSGGINDTENNTKKLISQNIKITEIEENNEEDAEEDIDNKEDKNTSHKITREDIAKYAKDHKISKEELKNASNIKKENISEEEFLFMVLENLKALKK